MLNSVFEYRWIVKLMSDIITRGKIKRKNLSDSEIRFIHKRCPVTILRITDDYVSFKGYQRDIDATKNILLNKELLKK